MTSSSFSSSSMTLSSVSNLPDSHPFHRLTNPTVQKKIAQVRDGLLVHVDANPELYDQWEVDRIRRNDWQVYRFLLKTGGEQVEPTIEIMKQTLQWRKTIRLADFKDSDFPSVFYQLGTLFTRPKDRQHNGVLFMRVRQHRKVSGMEQLALHHLLYRFNKLDIETEGKGIAIVFDCQGCGLANVDLNFVWNLLQIMLKYYPYGVSYVLVVDMPWIFGSCWRIIKSWIPEDFRHLIRFVNRDKILDYIEPENIPKYLGGQCSVSPHTVPPHILTLEQMVEKGLLGDIDDIRSIMKLYRPYLELAQNECQQYYS